METHFIDFSVTGGTAMIDFVQTETQNGVRRGKCYISANPSPRTAEHVENPTPNTLCKKRKNKL